MQWFGPPRDTIEEAQSDHKPTFFFDPAAVFKHENKYIMARIKDDNWPPQQAAEHMATLGYEMVACCDSLLGIWKPYPFQPRAAQ
jgi:long-subunit acyl-CoA synthetase (AMP-forming)